MVPYDRWVEYSLRDGASLSALLLPGRDHCGIYILIFGNGEEYVGQTVSLRNRIATHRRRWPDIETVRILDVAVDHLDDTETRIIGERAVLGKQLRNINLTSCPPPSEILDSFVDRQVQLEWMAGQTDPVVIGERGQLAAQRRRTALKHRELSARSDYKLLVAALARYVQECLPWPHQTEGRFWTVTSLPSTGRTRQWRRCAALSVHNVEMLVLGEWREDAIQEWQPSGFLNVDTSLPLGPQRRARNNHYRSTGPVNTIKFDAWTELMALLDERQVASAARSLAGHMLRKGNSLFAQFHDFHLADDIFIHLDNKTSGTSVRVDHTLSPAGTVSCRVPPEQAAEPRSLW